jgi:hypothetical protein
MKFDIEAYKRRTARLDDTDIDYGAFRERPLDGAALRCLRYMHDVEHHTTCYLRNLLNTRAHDDPEVTAFLTLWNYEEHWHGEALGRVLEAHGEVSGAPRVAAMRRRAGWRSTVSPVAWLAFSAATRHFLAVHMTFGAINEWTTQAGYARLGSLSGHPVLRDLLGRIMRQEGRHIDYYRSRAVELLADSPAAQRTTRRVLRVLWRPVGAKAMPAAETRHLVTTLFGGPDGQAVADRVDRRIDLLPGLSGLGLVRGSLDRYAA